MRSWFDVWLISTLIWGAAVAQYDSCHFDDYHSVLIEPTSVGGNYFYLTLPGVCGSPRGDVSRRLTSVRQTDTEGDLFVTFPDEKGRPIHNQFNVAPFCLAFSVGTIRGPTVLMQADDGTPLLTIGSDIEFSMRGYSVSFNASHIDIDSRARRLQICANGTHATFYLDCKAMETKPFVMSSSGINSVYILGERNTSTFEYINLFDGAVQQLYTVQCTDPRADLKVLSLVQCQSVPANADESGDGCSQEVQSNLTQVLSQVISELPTPPTKVQAFCDVVVWRNVQTISPLDISHFEVRFYNNKTGLKEMRNRTEDYEQFYVLTNECFKRESTTVQVRMNLFSSELFDPVSAYSSPINLGCKGPTTPSVHFELKGTVYNHGDSVLMTKIGTDENALLCKTNNESCCNKENNRAGKFFYPNNVEVRIKKESPEFYRDRGEQVVRLNRRMDLEEDTLPRGWYCCVVPDACDVQQRICINLIQNS